MNPLGILEAVYVISALIGACFMGVSLVIGDIGTGSDASDGGGATDGDFGDGSSAGDSGDSGDSGDNPITQALGALPGMSSHAPLMVAPPSIHRQNIFESLLFLLSPSAIAMFLAVFGSSGLIVYHLAPWIGFFSIIPAVVCALIFSAAYRAILRKLVRTMHVTTVGRVEDMVGQKAEVITPINTEYPGEITYVMGSKRYNAAARAYKAGSQFQRGAQVMIVEAKGATVLVEPWTDLDV